MVSSNKTPNPADVLERGETQRKTPQPIMNVIRPNCRTQFMPQDLDFIQAVLDPHRRVNNCLIKLFADPDTRDVVLDSDKLYQALLDSPECVNVSSRFYFYILVRHMLRKEDLDDRNLADYVAELLTEFSSAQRVRRPIETDTRPMDYLVDMLEALQTVDEEKQFLIRTHMGNHSLFLTGLFPGHVEFRTQYKAAPRVEYYESLGSTSYRVASHHHLAREYNLHSLFEILASFFHSIRLALNRLAEEILCLEPQYCPLLIRV